MEVISQDEQKRLEYLENLARQKAIMDYNTLMHESREEGIAEGISRCIAEGVSKGIAEGVVLGRFQTLTDLVNQGLLSITDAAAQANMTEAEFKEKTGL